MFLKVEYFFLETWITPETGLKIVIVKAKFPTQHLKIRLGKLLFKIRKRQILVS